MSEAVGTSERTGPGDTEGADDLPRDASISSTLVRGIEILQCFTSSDRTLGNAEIARRLGLNRPTVSRLCKTLAHLGYLRRDSKGTFQLAPKVLTLNYPVLSAMPWRYDVMQTMRELAEMCEGNASLGVMSGGSFVHVQTAGLPPGWPHVPDIGQNGPLHRSALGWSLLSIYSDTALNEKLAELERLNPEEFPRFADKAKQAITRCRTEGYCISYGDWRPNLVAAGTPLGRTEDGLFVALACAVPSYRAISEYFESDFGPRLAAAAEAIRLSDVFRLPEQGR